MNTVDPLPRQIGQCNAIVSGCQHLGLEPSHLARGRSLGIDGPSPDDMPHHRVERQTVRVVHVFVSGQTPEDRLAQQSDQCVSPIVTGSRVSQQTIRNVVQTKHLVQFPEQQETAV